jgi:TrmH family RNA methyltransferase
MGILDPRLKKYQKKYDYSYSFGTYPTIDLINHQREHLIKVLVKAKHDDSEGVNEVLDLCERLNIPVEVADRAIDKIATKENTYVLGIFHKYDSELDPQANHLVLVEPRNMGNLGTIIRTMLGFDVVNLAIIRPATDIFDPMVVRSTMGAIFQINFEYFDSIQEYMTKYSRRNIYTFMLDGAKDIREVQFEEPFSMIQGNESKGLPKEFGELGQSIFIPNSDKVDSLNLSVATAIGLWEARRGK